MRSFDFCKIIHIIVLGLFLIMGFMKLAKVNLKYYNQEINKIKSIWFKKIKQSRNLMKKNFFHH